MPTHAPAVNLRALSSQPFKPAQEQAQQHVEQTARALPKQPTPYIPRLPNPTPTQTKAALTIARNHAQEIGPKAFNELSNDPRNHEYIRTLQHYVAAYNQQQRHYETSLAGQMARSASILPIRESIARSLPELQKERKAEAESHDLRLKLPGATIDPAVAVAAVLKAAANVHVPIGGIVGKGLNEVIDLPGQTFLSSFQAGNASREALEGRPDELKTIGKGVLSQVEHPVKTFEQAPLSTALTLAGGEAGAEGLIARGLRTLPSDALKDALSTTRPDLKFYNEAPTQGPVEESGIGPAPAEGLRDVGRTYNSVPSRKLAQRAYEKGLEKLPAEFGGQKDAFQAEGWRLKRNVVGGKLKAGRVDYTTTGGEQHRRGIVKSIGKKVGLAKPDVGADAVPLILDRTIRRPDTLEADLATRAENLKSVQPELNGAELGKNKASLDRVEKLREDKKFLADPSEAFASAKRLDQIQKPLTALRVLHQSLDPDQLRASLFPYAQTHMGARYIDAKEAAEIAKTRPHLGLEPGLRQNNGNHLTTDAIKEHMAANGVEEPGFISHAPGAGGGSSWYQSVRKFPSGERFNRTGEAYRKGTAEHTYEAAAGTIAKAASKVAQHEVRAGDLSEYIVNGTRADTPAKAQRLADNLHATADGTPISPLGKLKVIDLGTHRALQAAEARNALHIGTDLKPTLDQFGLAQPSDMASEPGKYAAIPEEVHARMLAHDNAVSAKSDLKRFFQSYTQGFRHVKFATSPKHAAGVAEEQFIRLGAEFNDPVTALLANKSGRQLTRTLGELAQKDKHGVLADDVGPLGEQYRRTEGVLAGRGGVVASMKENDINRSGSTWRESSRAGALANRASRTHAMRAWVAYRHGTEAALTKLEHVTRAGLTGKALKQTRFIDNWRHALKLQDDGMKALIEGKLTMNQSIAIAKATDEMGGNWNHQPPLVRGAVSTATPFGLWWLNSMRWLYRTPLTHPVKTAIAASLYNATRLSRNEKGQGFDAPNKQKAYLQGTFEVNLPVFGKKIVDLGHYSPLGIAGPEAPNTVAEQLYPQFSGIQAALQGEDALSHEALKNAKGEELGVGSKLLNAVGEAVSGPTIGATQIQQVIQHGGKAEPTANLFTDLASLAGGKSQVKPGTKTPIGETLLKLLDPLKTYKPKATASGGAAQEAPQSPAEAARISRAVQRYETANGSPAEEARIKRAEERFDTVR